MRRDLVVIGASAGGIEALRLVLGELPRDFNAAICVVMHVAADSPGVLGDILGRLGPLEAVMVRGRERLAPGVIYVPCPDHHLLIEPGRAITTRGPRENRFRPAVDPLFRSAAQAYGPRVIGVILSGGLGDGTAGLWAIKSMGGVAVVQDPGDAMAESMPLNALRHVKVDHCLPAAQIGSALLRLTREDIIEAGGYVVPDRMKIEVNIAAEQDPLEAGVESLGEPSTFACPECHGVLRQLEEAGRVRFRCHTGHAYTSESLIAELDQAIENSLSNSIRALQEKALLARDLAEKTVAFDAEAGKTLRAHADDAQRMADRLREATVYSERMKKTQVQ
jgi:two-component system, chemotaxis family, protein-glutamate methylesterase/glutaminase